MTNPASAGYHQLPDGLWVKDSDSSGPYVFDGSTMTLAATGSGGGGGGGGAVTMAANAVAAGAYKAGALVDGADLTQGAQADAAVTAGAAGTISAKLRSISRDIAALIAQIPATLGIKTAAASLSVAPASDATFTTSAGGHKAQLTITRPANATPYTAGDVIGGTGTGVNGASLTFPLGAANQHVALTSIDLLHEVTAIPTGMTSFRLYLYSATPPSVLADNAAWDLAAGDVASFIGYVDFGVINDLGSNLFVQVDNVLKHVVLDASGNLYGYLVTNGGWTPGANSTVFVATLRTVGL